MTLTSGRAREKVYDFVKIPELYYAGSHGLDIVGPVTAEDGSVSLKEVEFQPAPWAPAAWGYNTTRPFTFHICISHSIRICISHSIRIRTHAFA